MLALFTIMHPLVDACSVSVLVAGGMSFERILAYNAMAFALQLPIGYVMDEYPILNRYGLFLGNLLCIGSAVLSALGHGGTSLLTAACLGNALFHLTAGKDILETHNGKGDAIGVFIATGALGLMGGQALMKHVATICLWGCAGSLLICTLVALFMWREEPFQAKAEDNEAESSQESVPLSAMAMLFLFALVAWRSWAGLMAGGRSSGGTVIMMLLGAAVIWAGKTAGGYMGDRWGRRKITFASVVCSAFLVFGCNPEWTIVWMPLLFVSQLATGPVLSLLYEKSGKHAGIAFGLNCLALFIGSLFL